MEFKHKYSKRCVVCKFVKTHSKAKEDYAHIRAANPSGHMSIRMFQSKWMPSTSTFSIHNHFKKHVFKVDEQTKTIVVPTSQKEVQNASNSKAAHESTLDTFITQFDEAVRKRELKITVKDGLSAIKIKADIEKANKDRKKDILKAMIGARGERGGPSEPAQIT